MLQPPALAVSLHAKLDGITSGIATMFDDPSTTGFVIADGLIAGLLCPPSLAFDFSLGLSLQFDDFKSSLSLFGSFALDIDVGLPPCPSIGIGVEITTLFGLRLGAEATIDCMHATADFFAEVVTPSFNLDIGLDIEICPQQPSVSPFIMEAFGQVDVAKGGILAAAAGAVSIG